MVKRVLDKTLFKFVMIGIINTLLGMAIMFGLYNLAGASYWLATAANYVIVSFLSFYLNKKFTFRHQGEVLKSGLRFAMNIGVCYLLAYGIAKPWVMMTLQGQSQALQENAAMLVGMCLFTGFNYFGQRLYVFKGKGKHIPLKTREELKAELDRVMKMDDDCEPGQYYDREAHIRRRNRIICDTYRNVIGVEPPEHVVRLIEENDVSGSAPAGRSTSEEQGSEEQESPWAMVNNLTEEESSEDLDAELMGKCGRVESCVIWSTSNDFAGVALKCSDKEEKLPETVMTKDGKSVCVIVGEVQ